MVDNTDEPVVEGEVVDSDQKTDNSDLQSEVSDQSTVLLSLDEMIKATFASIDRLTEESGKLRDMVNDGFAADANYKIADDEVKKATKARQSVKKEIMNRKGIIEMVNKLKDANMELKDKKASLSDYLLEYQRLSGANQLEMPNGEILEIVQVAKVVRKKK